MSKRKSESACSFWVLDQPTWSRKMMLKETARALRKQLPATLAQKVTPPLTPHALLEYNGNVQILCRCFCVACV